MKATYTIAVIGTFDTKGEEHRFLKRAIERRGFTTLTVNLGTKGPAPFAADIDLYQKIGGNRPSTHGDRDEAIEKMARAGQALIGDHWENGGIDGVMLWLRNDEGESKLAELRVEFEGYEDGQCVYHLWAELEGQKINIEID